MFDFKLDKVFKQNFSNSCKKAVVSASAFLLLFAFLFNIFGIIIAFKAQQNIIRKEIKSKIKQGVPANELHQFIISSQNANEFSWINPKEFIYRNMMYDIVKTEVVNENTILYYCVSDIQEKRLFAHLDELVKKDFDNKKDNKKTVDNVWKFLSNLYCQHSFISFENYQVFINETDLKNPYSNLYLAPTNAIHAPPPKV